MTNVRTCCGCKYFVERKRKWCVPQSSPIGPPTPWQEAGWKAGAKKIMLSNYDVIYLASGCKRYEVRP